MPAAAFTFNTILAFNTTEDPMIIYLNETWRIRGDALQWTVEHRTDPETQTHGRRAKGLWSRDGYFATLDGAIIYAARKQVRLMPVEVGAEALPEIVERLDQIAAECRAAAQRGRGFIRNHQERGSEAA